MSHPSFRPGLVSVIVGAAILALKFSAYHLTGSQAILSDALEGIINVVAAGIAYAILIWSSRPADRNHPYGHGKVEYFSASFEGGLIFLAGIVIVLAALQSLFIGREIAEIGTGTILAAGAGIANLLLGLYLKRSGERLQSTALSASASHVLSDVWTTAATIAGLLIVHATGWMEVDSLIAIGIGGLLLTTGIKISRRALGGLLDEEDTDVLEKLAATFNSVRVPGVIKVHHVRTIRSGAYQIVDTHVVVPEFWDVRHAHDEMNQFERQLLEAHSHKGEFHFHMDPCRRAYCAECDLADCPIRGAPFVARKPYTVEEIRAKKVHTVQEPTPDRGKVQPGNSNLTRER